MTKRIIRTLKMKKYSILFLTIYKKCNFIEYVVLHKYIVLSKII